MSTDVSGSSPNPLRQALGRVSPYSLLATLLGVALFFSRFGWKILNPTQIDWLMSRNDPGSYYLIWSFFRHEPWGFPLGEVSSYLYPLGTSVPLVDGLPLLAFPMKLISGILPVPFQYYGLWLLLCYGLQAFFGQRLARLALGDNLGSALGGLLFLLTPAFLYRQGHIALSSHWVLLAGIYLYLLGQEMGNRRFYRSWGALLFVVALIHPYLTVMVLVFFLAANVDRHGQWSVLHRALITVGGIVGVVFIWWVAGYFVGMGSEAITTEGFGKFSANLNTFINPMGKGDLLRERALLDGQYEGYSYLGVGWLLLLAASLFMLGIFRKPEKRHVLVLVSVVALFIFALSNKIVLGGRVLLEYEVPEFLETLTQTFRASGRFTWPLIYVGFFWILKSVTSKLRRRQLLALLGLAALLQVVDLPRMEFDGRVFRGLRYQPRLKSEHWDALAEGAGCVVAIPPFKHNAQEKGDYRDICFLASRHRIPTTAGYAGRISYSAARAARDSLLAVVAEGRAAATDLFIVERSRFPDIYLGLGNSWKASLLDNYHVCWHEALGIDVPITYGPAERVTLDAFLADFGDSTVLMAVQDEGRGGLKPEELAALTDRGIEVESLAYRGSMAAVLHGGRCVWQVLHKDSQVTASFPVGQTFKDFEVRRPMQLVSAGYLVGNRSLLKVDGRDLGFHRRGFNVVVLDAEQRPTHLGYFDTCIGEPGVVIGLAGQDQGRAP